jgi:hypothetical protein
MQDPTATTALPLEPDGKVDLPKLGTVVLKKRIGRPLTRTEQAMYDDAFAHPQGPRMISDAAMAAREGFVPPAPANSGAPNSTSPNGTSHSRRRGAGRPSAKPGSRSREPVPATTTLQDPSLLLDGGFARSAIGRSRPTVRLRRGIAARSTPIVIGSVASVPVTGR